MRKKKTFVEAVNFKLDCFFVGGGTSNSALLQPGSTNGQSGHKEGDCEENGGVMNNIMSDIQNGFVHRRLPDGGFKVPCADITLSLTTYLMPYIFQVVFVCLFAIEL